MMHTDTLMTALHEGAGPARDRLTTGAPEVRPPWIIACWEDAANAVTVSVLASATAELHHGRDGSDDRPAMPLPGGWLEAAVSSEARMRDLTTGPTRYLAGVGLLTGEITGNGRWTMRVRIAMNGGAFMYEHRDGGSHGTGAEARLRIDLSSPIWWDEQPVLEPLERYRATVTGDRPRLPGTAHKWAPSCPPSVPSWIGPR